MHGRSIGRALRRRGHGVWRGGRAGLTRPGVVLPRARGVAVHGAQAHHAFCAPGAPILGALGRGGAPARGRRAHGALRQPAVRRRAGRRAGEARGGAADAQQDVRHRALLLRHPAPPDRLAPLPRRVRRRRGGQERHAHRRRQGPGEELPQRLLRRLLPLRPVTAKGELLSCFASFFFSHNNDIAMVYLFCSCLFLFSFPKNLAISYLFRVYGGQLQFFQPSLDTFQVLLISDHEKKGGFFLLICDASTNALVVF